jgi:CheY-like chemotaxis protein
MKRILFVDDEVQILESIRDNLRKQRGRWEMVFVDSAKAALTELEKMPFDIVVSDMQMPVTDGATLLSLIRERYRLPRRRARRQLPGRYFGDSSLR